MQIVEGALQIGSLQLLFSKKNHEVKVWEHVSLGQLYWDAQRLRFGVLLQTGKAAGAPAAGTAGIVRVVIDLECMGESA